ncbi:MAG: peptidase M4, partial [Deltaproteobacteria bacterium]|nr:peptidase M4 [Deltaproteobacteria bacterium]
MNRRLYAIHRWLALAAMAQLAVWTATGLFFAVVPIESVRGEPSTRETAPAPVDIAALGPWPSSLQGATEVTLRIVDGRPLLAATMGERRMLVDARTGRPTEITREMASRIARADQSGSPAVQSITRIEDAPVEYRGKPVPAWCVALDDGAGTRVYVDALSGKVTARRNDLWRVYDFLWSLHIMDYGERE